jgi:hypothetical protein
MRATGALREAVLTRLGDTVGRQLSTALLLVLFAGWFWFLHRRWPLSTARQALLVGSLWLVVTLALETFMGRLLGDRPWSQSSDAPPGPSDRRSSDPGCQGGVKAGPA